MSKYDIIIQYFPLLPILFRHIIRWDKGEQHVFCYQKLSAVLLQDSFARAMQLLRYLCENSVGLEQWLDVLDDAGQSYELLENAGEAGMVPDFTGKNLEFCAICRF